MSNTFTKYSTFKEVYEAWMLQQHNNVSYSYESTMHSYIKKVSGLFLDKPIGEIDGSDLDLLFEKLFDIGLTSDTCCVYYRITKDFFNYLIDFNIISNNPLSNISRKIDREKYERQIHLLSANEMNNIIENAEKTPYKNLIKIIIYSGLRPKDLLALLWNNVDFEQHTITINNVKTSVDTCVIDFLLDELANQYNAKTNNCNWRNTYNFVFTDKNGNFIRIRTINAAIAKIGEKINIIDLKASDLIDYYIITALKNNVSPKTIVDQLGYATIDAIRQHIKIANITSYGMEVGNNASLTDLLYERYIKNNV